MDETGNRQLYRRFHLTKYQIEDCIKRSGTHCEWDFDTALGDTIKEKYESLYVKLVEVTNVMIRKGSKGFLWIVTSPEIASIFETATIGFEPVGYGYGYGIGPHQLPVGMEENTQFCGIINARWKLWKSDTLEPCVMLIGANPARIIEHGPLYMDEYEEVIPDSVDPSKCGSIAIANFVI